MGKKVAFKKWSKKILLFAIFIVCIILVETFNFRSNITFYLNRTSLGNIQIFNTTSAWEDLKEISTESLRNATTQLYVNKGISVSELQIRRTPQNNLQAINALLNKAYINVFEFEKNKIESNIYYKDDFMPSTAKKMLQQNGLNFCINSNLTNKKNKPLGLIIKHGIKVNPKVKGWRGIFFVKNKCAYAGADNMLNEISGEIECASQALPAIMNEGKIFDYVLQTKNIWFNSETISYRSLVGIKQNGNLVFIVSGIGGVLKIAEIAEIALKLGLKNATLLDGGKPLQYNFRDKNFNLSFHAYNTWLYFSEKKISKQRPPVYIGLKLLT